MIADWTGIPVGNMIRDELAKLLLELEDELITRMKGQDHVMGDDRPRASAPRRPA